MHQVMRGMPNIIEQQHSDTQSTKKSGERELGESTVGRWSCWTKAQVEASTQTSKEVLATMSAMPYVLLLLIDQWTQKGKKIIS